jgi:hypothetical protein
MCLIAHSAIDGDPRKRLSGANHHELGATHALSCDIAEGGVSEALLECTRELGGAESHDGGKVGSPDFRVHIGLDVGGHAYQLQGWETAAPTSFLSILFYVLFNRGPARPGADESEICGLRHGNSSWIDIRDVADCAAPRLGGVRS